MKFTVIVLLILFSVPSFAFKWSKCKGVYKKFDLSPSKSSNVGNQIVEYSVQITSQASFQSSTSTTSYVSSTGDCAAFAKAEEERYKYVAETIVELKMEAAEGQGEHVSSLAALYGCNIEAQSHFSDVMKANHSKIFASSAHDHSVDVMERMTDTVMNTDALRNGCNLEKI